MKIVVMSRQAIENFTFTEPCVVISISEPGYKPARIFGAGMVEEVLRLNFHDCDRDGNVHGYAGDNEPGVLQPITPEIGLKIVNFVEKWKDKVGTLYVHCHAGWSRSPGAACGIAYILGQDDAEFYVGRTPNMDVKWAILHAWRNKKSGEVLHRVAVGDKPGSLCSEEGTTTVEEADVTCERCKAIIETADGMQRAFDDFGRPEPELEGKCAVVDVEEEPDA